MRKTIARLRTIVMGILRELSDEEPYRRHLAAHCRAHSPDEWRHFLGDRLRARYTRPKCC